MNSNKVLAFIGSKWFVLGLGIAMLLILPTTYSNLMIVYEAGEMSRLWYIPTVFIMNLLTAIMAIYKATSRSLERKKQPHRMLMMIGTKMKIKLDYLILAQLVGFLLFYFISSNPFKSVILYFSFMTFFCYWIIKISFSEKLSNKKL